MFKDPKNRLKNCFQIKKLIRLQKSKILRNLSIVLKKSIFFRTFGSTIPQRRPRIPMPTGIRRLDAQRSGQTVRFKMRPKLDVQIGTQEIRSMVDGRLVRHLHRGHRFHRRHVLFGHESISISGTIDRILVHMLQFVRVGIRVEIDIRSRRIFLSTVEER